MEGTNSKETKQKEEEKKASVPEVIPCVELEADVVAGALSSVVRYLHPQPVLPLLLPLPTQWRIYIVKFWTRLTLPGAISFIFMQCSAKLAE